MRACRIARVGVAAVTAVITVTIVHAQQQKPIDDQELLNLLNAVKSEDTNTVKAPPSGTTPVDLAAEAVEVAGVRADDADEAMDAMDAEGGSELDEPSAKEVDSLSMSTSADNAVSIDSENLISVRLNRVGLEEAISLFAQLSGANIIVPELTDAAQISVNLKDVEWRPALQSILDTYDYELYQRVSGSNVYSVRRRPAGAPEPQVVETYILKYATVPNAAELIRDLLPDDAKVSEFASRNMLVVKSTESSLSEVRAVLSSIDTVRQQVYIESKFMELSDGAQKNLGIDWSVLSAYSVGTDGDTTYSYIKNRSDSRTESRFYDLEGNEFEQADGYANSSDPNRPTITTLEGLTPAIEDISSAGSGQILASVLSADQFRLVLSALEQNQGVNIVSNPKLIVANEEPANISIVRKEPNLKQERQQALNDTPDTITFTLDPELPFFEYGIKLDVVPSINTSSNITVQINPSLTRKFADKQAGDNTYPIIDEKSIQTIFNLASGQTAAIGGLTEVEESEEERKVPLLGSIPLLGRLFSWEQTVRGQDETIIFVTVGLANTQQLEPDTGMPSDAEMARRRVIKDRNARFLRDQGREYFESEENVKLNELIKEMREKEEKRIRKQDGNELDELEGLASAD